MEITRKKAEDISCLLREGTRPGEIASQYGVTSETLGAAMMKMAVQFPDIQWVETKLEVESESKKNINLERIVKAGPGVLSGKLRTKYLSNLATIEGVSEEDLIDLLEEWAHEYPQVIGRAYLEEDIEKYTLEDVMATYISPQVWLSEEDYETFLYERRYLSTRLIKSFLMRGLISLPTFKVHGELTWTEKDLLNFEVELQTLWDTAPDEFPVCPLNDEEIKDLVFWWDRMERAEKEEKPTMQMVLSLVNDKITEKEFADIREYLSDRFEGGGAAR